MEEKCSWKHCDNTVRDNPYRGHDTKFCSKKCKNKKTVDDLRRNRKLFLIKYLGGKCIYCGYNKCAASLHFHHLGNKEFNINSGITLKFELIKDEVDKCVLVCANCHGEIHHDCLNNGCVAQFGRASA